MVYLRIHRIPTVVTIPSVYSVPHFSLGPTRRISLHPEAAKPLNCITFTTNNRPLATSGCPDCLTTQGLRNFRFLAGEDSCFYCHFL